MGLRSSTTSSWHFICHHLPDIIDTCGAAAGIFQEIYVNSMVADALDLCVTKASTTLVFTTEDKKNPCLSWRKILPSCVINECCARSRYQGQGQIITSHSNYLPLISLSGTTLLILQGRGGLWQFSGSKYIFKKNFWLMAHSFQLVVNISGLMLVPCCEDSILNPMTNWQILLL